MFDGEDACFGEVCERGKLVFWEAVEFEGGLSALDGGDITRVGVDADVAGDEFACDSEEAFGGDGGSAAAFDVRLEHYGDGHIEVARGEAHLIFVRLDFHVHEDGERDPWVDDVLNGLQSGGESVFGSGEAHSWKISLRFTGWEEALHLKNESWGWAVFRMGLGLGVFQEEKVAAVEDR